MSQGRVKSGVVALAGAAAAAMALAWIAVGARGREDVYPPGSAHDASPLGLSLAPAISSRKALRWEYWTARWA